MTVIPCACEHDAAPPPAAVLAPQCTLPTDTPEYVPVCAGHAETWYEGADFGPDLHPLRPLSSLAATPSVLEDLAWLEQEGVSRQVWIQSQPLNPRSVAYGKEGPVRWSVMGQGWSNSTRGRTIADALRAAREKEGGDVR